MTEIISNYFAPMVLQKRSSLHFVFWFGALLFLSWFYTQLTQEYIHTLVLVAIVWPISFGSVYFINMFLLPKYLFTQKYKRFALFTSYTLIISMWIVLVLVYLYFYKLLIKTEGQGFPFEIDLAFIIAGMFLVIFAGVLSRVIRENFRIIKEKSELEQNQLLMKTKLKEVELQSLKSQFHPHFLFNTLNNLYSLSLKKSDEAPEMILKLSELLDYSLHSSEKNKVSLAEEIGFLKNYIDLALMRFSNGLEISFKKNIESPQYQLSPLLLIPFVENAIKHGVSPGDETNLISLRLTQVGKELIFEVDNPIVNPDVAKLKDSIRTGIGLNHVKQSLNILYPGAHQLEINEGEKTFSIKLQIHGN